MSSSLLLPFASAASASSPTGQSSSSSSANPNSLFHGSTTDVPESLQFLGLHCSSLDSNAADLNRVISSTSYTPQELQIGIFLHDLIALNSPHIIELFQLVFDEYQPDINFQHEHVFHSMTYLMHACLQQNHSLVEFLLAHDTSSLDINLQDSQYHHTALFFAIVHVPILTDISVDIVQSILAHRADPNILDTTEFPVLHRMMSRNTEYINEQFLTIVSLLLRSTIPIRLTISTSSILYSTPLRFLLTNRHQIMRSSHVLSLVQMLLDHNSALAVQLTNSEIAPGYLDAVVSLSKKLPELRDNNHPPPALPIFEYPHDGLDLHHCICLQLAEVDISVTPIVSLYPAVFAVLHPQPSYDILSLLIRQSFSAGARIKSLLGPQHTNLLFTLLCSIESIDTEIITMAEYILSTHTDQIKSDATPSSLYKSLMALPASRSPPQRDLSGPSLLPLMPPMAIITKPSTTTSPSSTSSSSPVSSSLPSSDILRQHINSIDVSALLTTQTSRDFQGQLSRLESNFSSASFGPCEWLGHPASFRSTDSPLASSALIQPSFSWKDSILFQSDIPTHLTNLVAPVIDRITRHVLDNDLPLIYTTQQTTTSSSPLHSLLPSLSTVTPTTTTTSKSSSSSSPQPSSSPSSQLVNRRLFTLPPDQLLPFSLHPADSLLQAYEYRNITPFLYDVSPWFDWSLQRPHSRVHQGQLTCTVPVVAALLWNNRWRWSPNYAKLLDVVCGAGNQRKRLFSHFGLLLFSPLPDYSVLYRLSRFLHYEDGWSISQALAPPQSQQQQQPQLESDITTDDGTVLSHTPNGTTGGGHGGELSSISSRNPTPSIISPSHNSTPVRRPAKRTGQALPIIERAFIWLCSNPNLDMGDRTVFSVEQFRHHASAAAAIANVGPGTSDNYASAASASSLHVASAAAPTIPPAAATASGGAGGTAAARRSLRIDSQTQVSPDFSILPHDIIAHSQSAQLVDALESGNCLLYSAHQRQQVLNIISRPKYPQLTHLRQQEVLQNRLPSQMNDISSESFFGLSETHNIPLLFKFLRKDLHGRPNYTVQLPDGFTFTAISCILSNPSIPFNVACYMFHNLITPSLTWNAVQHTPSSVVLWADRVLCQPKLKDLAPSEHSFVPIELAIFELVEWFLRCAPSAVSLLNALALTFVLVQLRHIKVFEISRSSKHYRIGAEIARMSQLTAEERDAAWRNASSLTGSAPGSNWKVGAGHNNSSKPSLHRQGMTQNVRRHTATSDRQRRQTAVSGKAKPGSSGGGGPGSAQRPGPASPVTNASHFSAAGGSSVSPCDTWSLMTLVLIKANYESVGIFEMFSFLWFHGAPLQPPRNMVHHLCENHSLFKSIYRNHLPSYEPLTETIRFITYFHNNSHNNAINVAMNNLQNNRITAQSEVPTNHAMVGVLCSRLGGRLASSTGPGTESAPLDRSGKRSGKQSGPQQTFYHHNVHNPQIASISTHNVASFHPPNFMSSFGLYIWRLVLFYSQYVLSDMPPLHPCMVQYLQTLYGCVNNNVNINSAAIYLYQPMIASPSLRGENSLMYSHDSSVDDFDNDSSPLQTSAPNVAGLHDDDDDGVDNGRGDAMEPFDWDNSERNSEEDWEQASASGNVGGPGGNGLEQPYYAAGSRSVDETDDQHVAAAVLGDLETCAFFVSGPGAQPVFTESTGGSVAIAVAVAAENNAINTTSGVTASHRNGRPSSASTALATSSSSSYLRSSIPHAYSLAQFTPATATSLSSLTQLTTSSSSLSSSSSSSTVFDITNEPNGAFVGPNFPDVSFRLAQDTEFIFSSNFFQYFIQLLLNVVDANRCAQFHIIVFIFTFCREQCQVWQRSIHPSPHSSQLLFQRCARGQFGNYDPLGSVTDQSSESLSPAPRSRMLRSLAENTPLAAPTGGDAQEPNENSRESFGRQSASDTLGELVSASFSVHSSAHRDSTSSNDLSSSTSNPLTNTPGRRSRANRPRQRTQSRSSSRTPRLLASSLVLGGNGADNSQSEAMFNISNVLISTIPYDLWTFSILEVLQECGHLICVADMQTSTFLQQRPTLKAANNPIDAMVLYGQHARELRSIIHDVLPQNIHSRSPLLMSLAMTCYQPVTVVYLSIVSMFLNKYLAHLSNASVRSPPQLNISPLYLYLHSASRVRQRAWTRAFDTHHRAGAPTSACSSPGVRSMLSISNSRYRAVVPTHSSHFLTWSDDDLDYMYDFTFTPSHLFHVQSSFASAWSPAGPLDTSALLHPVYHTALTPSPLVVHDKFGLSSKQTASSRKSSVVTTSSSNDLPALSSHYFPTELIHVLSQFESAYGRWISPVEPALLKRVKLEQKRQIAPTLSAPLSLTNTTNTAKAQPISAAVLSSSPSDQTASNPLLVNAVEIVDDYLSLPPHLDALVNNIIVSKTSVPAQQTTAGATARTAGLLVNNVLHNGLLEMHSPPGLAFSNPSPASSVSSLAGFTAPTSPSLNGAGPTGGGSSLLIPTTTDRGSVSGPASPFSSFTTSPPGDSAYSSGAFSPLLLPELVSSYPNKSTVLRISPPTDALGTRYNSALSIHYNMNPLAFFLDSMVSHTPQTMSLNHVMIAFILLSHHHNPNLVLEDDDDPCNYNESFPSPLHTLLLTYGSRCPYNRRMLQTVQLFYATKEYNPEQNGTSGQSLPLVFIPVKIHQAFTIHHQNIVNYILHQPGINIGRPEPLLQGNILVHTLQYSTLNSNFQFSMTIPRQKLIPHLLALGLPPQQAIPSEDQGFVVQLHNYFVPPAKHANTKLILSSHHASLTNTLIFYSMFHLTPANIAPNALLCLALHPNQRLKELFFGVDHWSQVLPTRQQLFATYNYFSQTHFGNALPANNQAVVAFTPGYLNIFTELRCEFITALSTMSLLEFITMRQTTLNQNSASGKSASGGKPAPPQFTMYDLLFLFDQLRDNVTLPNAWYMSARAKEDLAPLISTGYTKTYQGLYTEQTNPFVASHLPRYHATSTVEARECDATQYKGLLWFLSDFSVNITIEDILPLMTLNASCLSPGCIDYIKTQCNRAQNVPVPLHLDQIIDTVASPDQPLDSFLPAISTSIYASSQDTPLWEQLLPPSCADRLSQLINAQAMTLIDCAAQNAFGETIIHRLILRHWAPELLKLIYCEYSFQLAVLYPEIVFQFNLDAQQQVQIMADLIDHYASDPSTSQFQSVLSQLQQQHIETKGASLTKAQLAYYQLTRDSQGFSPLVYFYLSGYDYAAMYNVSRRGVLRATWDMQLIQRDPNSYLSDACKTTFNSIQLFPYHQSILSQQQLTSLQLFARRNNCVGQLPSLLFPVSVFVPQYNANTLQLARRDELSSLTYSALLIRSIDHITVSGDAKSKLSDAHDVVNVLFPYPSNWNQSETTQNTTGKQSSLVQSSSFNTLSSSMQSSPFLSSFLLLLTYDGNLLQPLSRFTHDQNILSTRCPSGAPPLSSHPTDSHPDPAVTLQTMRTAVSTTSHSIYAFVHPFSPTASTGLPIQSIPFSTTLDVYYQHHPWIHLYDYALRDSQVPSQVSSLQTRCDIYYSPKQTEQSSQALASALSLSSSSGGADAGTLTVSSSPIVLETVWEPSTSHAKPTTGSTPTRPCVIVADLLTLPIESHREQITLSSFLSTLALPSDVAQNGVYDPDELTTLLEPFNYTVLLDQLYNCVPTWGRPLLVGCSHPHLILPYYIKLRYTHATAPPSSAQPLSFPFLPDYCRLFFVSQLVLKKRDALTVKNNAATGTTAAAAASTPGTQGQTGIISISQDSFCDPVFPVVDQETSKLLPNVPVYACVLPVFVIAPKNRAKLLNNLTHADQFHRKIAQFAQNSIHRALFAALQSQIVHAITPPSRQYDLTLNMLDVTIEALQSVHEGETNLSIERSLGSQLGEDSLAVKALHCDALPLLRCGSFVLASQVIRAPVERHPLSQHLDIETHVPYSLLFSNTLVTFPLSYWSYTLFRFGYPVQLLKQMQIRLPTWLQYAKIIYFRHHSKTAAQASGPASPLPQLPFFDFLRAVINLPTTPPPGAPSSLLTQRSNAGSIAASNASLTAAASKGNLATTASPSKKDAQRHRQSTVTGNKPSSSAAATAADPLDPSAVANSNGCCVIQ